MTCFGFLSLVVLAISSSCYLAYYLDTKDLK